MYILANLELQRLKAKRNFPNTQKECRYNFNNQEALFCIGKLLKTPNKKTHGVAFAEDLIRATNLVQDVLDELEAYWVSWLIGILNVAT